MTTKITFNQFKTMIDDKVKALKTICEEFEKEKSINHIEEKVYGVAISRLRELEWVEALMGKVKG